MIVTEAHMLSGYVPEETDQELLQRLQRQGIARAEIKDKSVIFYMDEVVTYIILLTQNTNKHVPVLKDV